MCMGLISSRDSVHEKCLAKPPGSLRYQFKHQRFVQQRECNYWQCTACHDRVSILNDSFFMRKMKVNVPIHLIWRVFIGIAEEMKFMHLVERTGLSRACVRKIKYFVQDFFQMLKITEPVVFSGSSQWDNVLAGHTQKARCGVKRGRRV